MEDEDGEGKEGLALHLPIPWWNKRQISDIKLNSKQQCAHCCIEQPVCELRLVLFNLFTHIAIVLLMKNITYLFTFCFIQVIHLKAAFLYTPLIAFISNLRVPFLVHFLVYPLQKSCCP